MLKWQARVKGSIKTSTYSQALQALHQSLNRASVFIEDNATKVNESPHGKTNDLHM